MYVGRRLGRQEVHLVVKDAVARWRVEVEKRGGGVRAALSDIYSVQHVKRVICHLIETLCVARTLIPEYSLLSLLFSPLCCYLYPRGKRSNQKQSLRCPRPSVCLHVSLPLRHLSHIMMQFLSIPCSAF